MEKPDLPDPSYQATYQRLPYLAKLRDAISPLPLRHRLAFALCCCERLLPGYQALVNFLQQPNLLRPILDRLWQYVLGQAMTPAEIAQCVATCQSLPPGDADSYKEFDDALDTVLAVLTTLEACQKHTLDNVVRAAEAARNRIDRPLWQELAQQAGGVVGPDENREIEMAILSHPTMVAEVEKEASQLRFLYECEELTESSVARLLSL